MVALALGVGSLASILLAAVLVESPNLGDVAGLLGSVVLFGVGFTGLAVGISASVRTRGKAMAVAIGSLLVWDAAPAGLYATVTGSLPGLEVEAWYFLLKRLSPVGAFRAVAETFVDGRLQPFFQMGLEEVPGDATPEQLRLTNRVSGPLPFYLSNWFAAATLAAWGVVPVLVGYLRFERSDV